MMGGVREVASDAGYLLQAIGRYVEIRVIF